MTDVQREVKEVSRGTEALGRGSAMAEVENVLRRLGGRRVRVRCRPAVPYENPIVGEVERVVAGQVLLRVHPTRIDGIPLGDIVGVDILPPDDEE